MNRKILIAEDDAAICELMTFILQQAGYAVTSMARGDMALEEAKIHPPDLILMDVMMQPTDGYRVCRQLKQNQLTTRIPVILVSAKGQDKEKEEGMIAGASAYLVKPFEAEELVGTVKNFIGEEG